MLMKVIKFVTEDFKSPGYYGQLDYSKFGIPIEVEVDPKEKGQCARGIHVVPINEDSDLTNVIFTDTMILLEVEECDIVYCEKNGKMRVRKATPIRQVKKSDKEWEIIRKTACRSPEYAYYYALNADRCITPEARTGVCKDPEYAYYYALNIDDGSTDEIRTAVCKKPLYAYWYAKDIDKKPTDETRTAACNDPGCAYKYALHVDKKPTNETRICASKDQYWKKQYELWEKG
jgi:hypothetical protein